ncbi:FAD-dependent oxidoreductase [Mucilaginibacter sp.]|uniref:FAD-dependent oxidoreductase n=1 Tax=Mucilaginibacter sp. TaxID=1882438 RepID=UPI0026094CA7|nr:FAD-dependent oxidoreductase [Mucilaginibacter sp.]MDB4918062.1 dependent oxidoreductase [Mucilaginibacter sp.]
MKVNSSIDNTAHRTVKAARDGNNESPWQAALEIDFLKSGSLIADIHDILIIGGGITGLTAALLLKKSGKNIVLADAASPGFGTTGGTSAHINTFADTTYKEAEEAFGEKGAQLFADAINEGFQIINDNINTYKINCDYESKTGYLYAEDTDQAKQLEDVFHGAKQVGIKVRYTDDVPTPISYVKALQFDGQAQFHPLKYMQGIADAYLKAGGLILTDTKIEDLLTADGVHTAKAGSIKIKARNVIYATHIPPGVTSFNFRCAPYRSYVLGVKLKNDKYPDALIYDMQEPYHYFRTHEIEGQKLLIAGGNDHKTGHKDPEKAFEDLEMYIRKHYQVSSVKYKWSSQYYIPVDGFPYIGQMPGTAHGIYCATGYNGNGMMLGTIAGKIISDLITGKVSKYEKVFSPARIKPIAGFTEFVKENADVAYHFVADRLSVHETDSLKRIQKDSGKVVEFEGKKVAAYRDAEGTIHALNPVCTHAKCIVNWNQEEKSWDCPCHGARYDIDGKVLNGPAEKDLQKIDQSADE